jgi:predicted GIY-YIG superfamily endonuclease
MDNRNNMTEKNTEKHFWLYILKLKQDKYYVGTTSQYYAEDRIDQHKNGFYSAQWVKKYGYDSVVEVRELGYVTKEEAEREEKRVTLEYMEKFGRENVRGGDLNYSGKYFWRFGRVFRDEEWKTFTLVIFLLLVIAVFVLDKYIW